MMNFGARLIILLIFASPVAALAHGVESRVLGSGAVAVQFRFTDGTVMAFADAVAYAPGRSGEPAVSGHTDAEGRFSLFPDQDGDWAVEVHDADDHVARAMVHVAGFQAVVPHSAFPDWLVAVSLVCNVLGAAWLGGRRSALPKLRSAGTKP
jgi:hypothetical protein